MKIHHAEGTLTYDGAQLRSNWAYRNFGVTGDSIVAFRGPCEIPSDNIVDLEDLRAGSRIAGPDMVHFIIEHFDLDLEKAVLRQRLLSAIVRDEISARSGKTIERQGDDLYDGDRKLSISIATLSPVSSMIHFAVNVVRAEGVGVPTGALEDFKIDPGEFATEVARLYADEMTGIDEDRSRVRGVV